MKIRKINPSKFSSFKLKINEQFNTFKAFYKSKVFLLMFVSYILVLAISVGTAIFTISKQQNILAEQIQKQNTNYLDNIHSNVYTGIESISEIYSYIINHPDTNKLMSFKTTRDYNINRDVADFLSTIYSFPPSSVSNFFIYIEGSDTILSQYAICNSQNYYRAYFETSNISYKDWYSIVTSKPDSMFLPFNSDGETKMLYKISYTNYDGNRMFLCAITDETLFFGNLGTETRLSSCDIYISDSAEFARMEYKETGEATAQVTFYDENDGVICRFICNEDSVTIEGTLCWKYLYNPNAQIPLKNTKDTCAEFMHNGFEYAINAIGGYIDDKTLYPNESSVTLCRK